jgi:transcriptional regulator with XRE-family HTH domain
MQKPRQQQTLELADYESRTPNTIRTCRKESGLGQKELAFLMGLKSTGTLSRYENGLITPDLENTFALQFALKTPVQLLYRDLATRIAGEVRERQEQLGKPTNP